jgi:hypothetical protein
VGWWWVGALARGPIHISVGLRYERCRGGGLSSTLFGCRMWPLFVVLLWAAPLGCLGASRFHERNHTGLLFLYTFDEGQQSASPPSEIRDVSGRNLMGNLTASTTGAVTWSETRQGMAIPSVAGGARASSRLTSAELLPLLSSEFSIEFFFSSPDNNLSQNLFIAGFGDWPAGEPFARCNATNTVSEGGWRLSSQLGRIIEIDVVMVVDGAPACVKGTTAFAYPLRHLVVRVRDGVLSIIAHGGGSAVLDSTMVFSQALWARHAAPLTIANPHVTTGWTGTMYMIAMYDRFLSNAELTANRVFGPPNSFPYGAGAVLADEDTPATLVAAA